MLDPKIPDGPLEQKWSRYRSTAKLVSPANRKWSSITTVAKASAVNAES
jgi:succinate dehydrogenase flavoprotein subunit